MKKLTLPLIILSLVSMIIASITFSLYVKERKDNKIALNNIIALTDSIKIDSAKIAGLNVAVFEKHQLLLSQKEATKAALIERDAARKLGFSYLNEITKLRAQIDIVRDSVANSGTVIYVDSVKQKPAILLPFTFSDIDKYHSLIGGFTLSGSMNYSLSLPVSLSIYTGVDRKGNTKVSITTDNPYVKINELMSVKTDFKKPKRFGIVAYGGYGIGLDGKFRPSIGLGFGYLLWGF